MVGTCVVGSLYVGRGVMHGGEGACVTGGMCGGACMAGVCVTRACVVGHVWWGVCSRGCGRGHAWQGVYMLGGHVWQSGVCMACGMHGKEHVWLGGICGMHELGSCVVGGACMVQEEACVACVLGACVLAGVCGRSVQGSCM